MRTVVPDPEHAAAPEPLCSWSDKTEGSGAG